MKIPNSGRASVDEAKVRDYLLSVDHPVGRFKARVFFALGYRPETWQRLRDDLTRLAVVGDAVPTSRDEFGERWSVTGNLVGPTGKTLRFVTVWLIPSGGSIPLLVTAYPASPS